MPKDAVTTPMEPFTSDEKAALYERLDRLSGAELASYIGSAKSSLGNRALDPTWRPRVELALKHAELAYRREEEAAARIAAEQSAKVPAPIAKVKKTARSNDGRAAEAEEATEPHAGAPAADPSESDDEA